MLGDFGEVYALDWGIAKLVSTPDPLPEGGRPSISAETHGVTSTRDGTTLGTPGYMAPEQVDGAAHVNSRADVYSLGAILFELLCLEPLHARTTVAGKLSSTLEGADARASIRAPQRDVPPELEDICVKATALEPAQRFQSVGELIEAIEHFLDGDRDLEHRRRLAAEHAIAAAAAAQEALAESVEPTESRRKALREVARALAFVSRPTRRRWGPFCGCSPSRHRGCPTRPSPRFEPRRKREGRKRRRARCWATSPGSC